ncbi:MAG: DUF6711 family protein [Clostridium sp.]|uniref:DUF6711 family protein n=1 Tax=Clostridium sp. TaxID=1506 RepID=UPI002FCC465A
MELIKINGVEIPTPSTYQIGIQDISNAERNANGTMIIERIATKRKIELSWNLLDRTKASILLNAVSQIFFEVQYVDPEDNGIKTGTFYCGDRTIPMITFVKGVPKYKGITFNIIER